MDCVIKVGEARAQWWKDHMSSLLPNYNFFVHSENFKNDSIKPLQFLTKNEDMDSLMQDVFHGENIKIIGKYQNGKKVGDWFWYFDVNKETSYRKDFSRFYGNV